jgi:tetratricopeptide (TPR) repeat protein
VSTRHETRIDGLRAAALAAIEQAEQKRASGLLDQADKLINSAIVLSRRCGDRQLLGWALMEQGRLAYTAGRHLAAYAASSQACKLLAECHDVGRHAHALNTCALVYISGDDLASRVELLRKGLLLAGEPEHWAIRCRLLHNLGIALCENNEYIEAVECLSEAVDVAQRAGPPLRLWELLMASRLAFIHLQYADHLGRSGSADKARLQLEAAARTLPALSAECWRGTYAESFTTLWPQIEVLAQLGRWDSARRAAAACLRFARRSRQSLVNLGWALTGLSALYRRQGQHQRSIQSDHRALAVWRRANYRTEVITCLGRLADLHARSGAYTQALALRRELAAHQSRRRHEAGALRCRLAAIERQAERRLRQAQEAVVHAERLAIVGRLIAQTHHALSAPIAQTQSLTAQAVAPALEPAALRPLLAGINQAIDSAAGLVSQLKLFSYRSSPQPMALSLHKALLDAWHGLDPHIGSRDADLHISGHTQRLVWGDAQRLGIMLKVLLIELMQRACSNSARVVIGAHIYAGAADTVLLHIETRRGAIPLPAAAASPSLGSALCMEIAAEMQGELCPVHDDAAMLRYRLQLPDAESQRCATGGKPMPPATPRLSA